MLPPKTTNHSSYTSSKERSTTMLKKTLGAMLVVILALSIMSVASAQEKKTMGKKTEKTEMALKSVSCDPACGFMVQSHDEKELTSIVIAHAKSAHHKDLTADDVKGMMKSASEKKMK
jgi:predicted small metal-binding protein